MCVLVGEGQSSTRRFPASQTRRFEEAQHFDSERWGGIAAIDIRRPKASRGGVVLPRMKDYGRGGTGEESWDGNAAACGMGPPHPSPNRLRHARQYSSPTSTASPLHMSGRCS